MYRILSKAGHAFLTVFLVSVIIFVMFQIIPGDPVLSKLGEDPDPALEAYLRGEYGLDRPAPERYARWVAGVITGDFGTSIRFNLPVRGLIAERLPFTAGLTVMTMILVVFLGIPLGVVTAKHARNARGFAFNAVTQLCASVPSFYLAIVLIIVFCVKLKWFDVMGYVPLNESVTGFIKGLTLPAIAIAAGSLATVARYTRSSVLEQLGMDYVKTARNKGLSKNRILYAHVFPNALATVITILGMMVANVLGGAIVVESAFSIPGIGSLLHLGIKSRDLPLVQGVSMYISTVVVIVFMVLDILYVIIDPRMRS